MVRGGERGAGAGPGVTSASRHNSIIFEEGDNDTLIKLNVN
jgi:hypothetical protein